ncbi:N-acetyltransferase GCN5 [Bibersteinia trehalosi Y31]|uniref:N-acetyltransferase GCN5 n=1 Tax=Bibersteinia trehalosi Y31 TaxID=1261658 RepID=A0A179D1G8_BIBTR|nr:N-acetyltransferase GCN5 [Bibersteinia trehalosi Y31]
MILLKDAVLRAKAVSEQIGVRALLVHALNEQAKHFYLKYGFSESLIDEMILMLRLS